MKVYVPLVIASVSALAACGNAQGGLGGGGFGGGFGGGGMAQGGQGQQQYDRSAQEIERKISRYLDSKEIKNIVTPGEYSEWPLTLKAGQVVIAEARSDAFDPALEVVDGKGEGKHKVLATNDDRYPGDQRPLLLWRCAKDGDYSLRVRGFQGKAGGQVFVRMKVYETLDLVEGKTAEGAFDHDEPFLLRATLKRGSMVEVIPIGGDWPTYTNFGVELVVSPLGLPDAGLAAPFDSVLATPVVAPMDGDYYVVCRQYSGSRSKIRALLRDLTPKSIARADGKAKVPIVGGTANAWKVELKKGEVVQVRGFSILKSGRVTVSEEPDMGVIDPKKPENSPFFPKVQDPTGKGKRDKEPANGITMLPSRAKDPREVKFAALKDVTVWVVASGTFGGSNEAAIEVGPADADLSIGGQKQGRLGVGNVDYWSFEAKVGDVISMSAGIEGFAAFLDLRDSELAIPWRAEIDPDQPSLQWNYVVRRPGKHLLSIESLGGGGGGTYSLTRSVLPAREFSNGQAAAGNFSLGTTEVWRCTLKAYEAMLLRLWGTPNGYSLAVFNENGDNYPIGLVDVDGQNRYAILKPAQPATFIFVFNKIAGQAEYRIDVSPLAGGKPGG